MHHQLGTREVGGHAVVIEPEIFDGLVAEHHLEHPARGPAREKRNHRQGEIAVGSKPDPPFAIEVYHFSGSESTGVLRRNRSAHAGPAEPVYGDSQLLQRPNHSDVSEPPGATSAQDQGDRLAPQMPSQAIEIGGPTCSYVMMGGKTVAIQPPGGVGRL